MTREEAQKLLGGYATGSLTEEQRKLLFEAALEDQDLFDDLAREHDLKLILDEPGAKTRLIAALAPARPRFSPLWLWTASAAAIACAVLAGWILLRAPKPPAVVEVAHVAEPQPAPPVGVSTAAPAAPAENKRRVAPRKQTAAEDQLSRPTESGSPLPAGAAGGRIIAQPHMRALAQRAPAAKAAPFGFDYVLEPEFLTLKFSAAGWLHLHYAPGDDTIELTHVAAGETRRIAIPNNATEADIVFAIGPQTDPSLGVNLTRTDKSGSVQDPSGNRIEFLLKFY